MAEGININEKDVQKENVPDDLNSLAVEVMLFQTLLEEEDLPI